MKSVFRLPKNKCGREKCVHAGEGCRPCRKYKCRYAYDTQDRMMISFLCVLSAGCQGADASEETAPEQAQDTVSAADLIADLPAPIDTDATEEEEVETAKDELPPKKDASGLSDEQIALYQQASLYIQEGFWTYGIDDVYHAYFAPVSSDKVKAVLVRGDVQWYEAFSYTYDEETGWYTFSGEYEPVFAKDDINMGGYSDAIEEILGSYVYEVEISKEAEIPASRRYEAEDGPIEHEVRLSFGRDCETWVYTYYDDRMDIYITIEYPQFYYGKYGELTDTINESLREAFFYGFSSDSDGLLPPQDELYTSIERQFQVTRWDEDYLSMRIYYFISGRGAGAHPSDGERGVTIDMKTGRVLSLEDVVGEGWTMEKLLESGAFKTMWEWMPPSGDWIEDELKYTREYHSGESLSEYAVPFYITDTSLGLVTYQYTEYTNIEAKFSDLGISGF